MDRTRGIGNKGDLPWQKLKGDMRFFRELTTCPDRAAVEKRWGLKREESADVQAWSEVSNMLKFAHPLPASNTRNVVIMGRKTWDSLPENFRPLPDRQNIVLTRKGLPEEVIDQISFGPLEMIERIGELFQLPRYVIGGGQIFAEVLKNPESSHLYITEIDAEFECDTFFPETPDFKPVLSSPWVDEGGIRYRFRRYDRVS